MNAVVGFIVILASAVITLAAILGILILNAAIEARCELPDEPWKDVPEGWQPDSLD